MLMLGRCENQSIKMTSKATGEEISIAVAKINGESVVVAINGKPTEFNMGIDYKVATESKPFHLLVTPKRPRRLGAQVGIGIAADKDWLILRSELLMRPRNEQ